MEMSHDSVWDVGEYVFEKNDNDDVVAIFSKDMMSDDPTNNYLQLTCYGLTYDRLMKQLETATKIEIEDHLNPERLMPDGDGICTEIQVYDEYGVSECIIVGEIRLPNRITTVTDCEMIKNIRELIKQLESESTN